MCACLGPEAVVDGEPPARIGLEARSFESEVFGRTLSARGVEHEFGGNPLAARETGHGRAVGASLDRADLFAKPQREPETAQVVAEGVDEFVVDEIEQLGALVDEGDTHAERRGHRRVLHTDHTRAHDSHGRRNTSDAGDAIRIDDCLVVEVDTRRSRGPRADGDHDLVGTPGLWTRPADLQGVRIEEGGPSDHHFHVVTPKLVADDSALVLHHVLGAPQEIIIVTVLLNRYASP